MAITKQHREFHSVDLDNGWEVPPGYPFHIVWLLLELYILTRYRSAPATGFQEKVGVVSVIKSIRVWISFSG